ncbi:SDR family NAD(P)-dependent oxidoreductase [Algibacter amylolyticus]|uniref:SDR family NAD(P)-dependent oxidoreductase n=1 Tax=Algibacter amylolyticus TaxID=1608400 RepID=A0A5M7AVN5_9FLAO|nr:SDR family NAD(P)-dependent oxidoreductase [Algibacter amylolyticus]KAA5821389.1 SDR family NAD(P)-dependent oxidoreductase [Algibacter amylolyticus]MBB5268258.1 NAD(P)-dependent dehydrogenase (short-subunit alcohol dehydrogenase family) [Algibacter amylolyticus]TSJ72901.1 SDR family NAD(P)-dependent oxidoreductase [Algibacter amylolyticus]
MSKTIIVTGSTDGIGKLTALSFAEKGHTTYVHGRNEAKVDTVVSEIKTKTNNQNIHGLVADFSDLEAVSELAVQIKKYIPKIDILINNAGIFKTKEVHNKNGLDIRMVVNYLAPYVLTNAILENIKQSDAPRIINLSSAAQAPVSEAVLIGKEQDSENSTYAQSKLALTMWSFNLAKQEPSINVIAVNPGSLLNTKMANEAYGQHWSPAEKGVDILVDLALSVNYKNDSGKYFDNDKGGPKGYFAPAHPDAYDVLKIRNLLTVTNKLLAN